MVEHWSSTVATQAGRSPTTKGAGAMAGELSGRKVAIRATDGVERVELEQPRSAVTDAGAEVELLSIRDGEIAARDHDLEDAGTFAVDGLVSDAAVQPLGAEVPLGDAGVRVGAHDAV